MDEVILLKTAIKVDELKTVMAGVEQNVLSVEAVDKLPIIWAKVKKQSQID